MKRLGFVLVIVVLLAVVILLMNREPGDEEITSGVLSTDAGEYHYEVLAANLDAPWEIVILPDGEILVTESVGRLSLIDQGRTSTIHEFEEVGDAGLLGMTLGPDFDVEAYLYLYYAYEDTFNRVSRFLFDGDGLGEEEVIIDQIPGHRFHSGGRLVFGPDDKLYITTGDAEEPDLSQDLNSLAGKVLRVNPDGTLPEDNPFEDSPVYAFGIRNAQGMAINPDSGGIFISDHGPTHQDEINIIEPGKNYGWPLVSCGEGETEYQDPLICYEDFTLAPAGMDFFPADNDHPSALYVAGLRSEMVKRFTFSEDGQVLEEHDLFQDWGRIRAVAYHQGALYLATSNRDGLGDPAEEDDRLIRLTPQ